MVEEHVQERGEVKEEEEKVQEMVQETKEEEMVKTEQEEVQEAGVGARAGGEDGAGASAALGRMNEARVEEQVGEPSSAVAGQVDMSDLPGDIFLVAPVTHAMRQQVPKLSHRSLLVIVCSGDSHFFDDGALYHERINWGWKRGVGDLSFAARFPFMQNIHILDEGASYDKSVQWIVGRFTLSKTTAALSVLSVGAVLLREAAWRVDRESRRMWQDLADGIIENGARVIYLLAEPYSNIEFLGDRLTDLLKATLRSSARAQCKEVQVMGGAFGESVQVLLIGEYSSFAYKTQLTVRRPPRVGDGNLRMQHILWKQRVLGYPMSTQGTLDMLLPPLRLYTMPGLMSVWFQGNQPRSDVARERRRLLEVQRMGMHLTEMARQGRLTGRVGTLTGMLSLPERNAQIDNQEENLEQQYLMEMDDADF